MRYQSWMVAIIGLAGACTDDGTRPGTGQTDDTDIVSYEDGCIDVSGASQGFKFLADAITVAEPGASIELCNDVEEAIFVNKELFIYGNGALLIPPPNDMAVTVQDGGALTIKDVVIQTTRSGMVVETGGSLIAEDIDIAEVANYGFDVAEGATAEISEASILGADWGGFRVQGGTLTVRDSEVNEAGSFGVFADGGATVTLENNRFATIEHRDSSTQIWDIDGVGVWIEGGSNVTMSGNSVVLAQITGVSVDGLSTLSMDGDEIIGVGTTFAGLAVRSSSVTASNISVSEYAQYGMLAIDADELSFASSSFTANPDLSAPNVVGDPADPSDDRIGSVGLYALESEITVTGTEELPSVISGNNGAGILTSPQSGGSVSAATLDHVLIDNNGGFGLTVYSGDATISNTTISNTRNDDAYCDTGSGYRCNMAVGLWTSEGTFTDVTVADSEGWGITVVNGFLDISGSEFSNNITNSVFSQSSTAVVDDSLFTAGSDVHLSMQQGSSATITNSTFKDNDYTAINEYESGDSLVRTVSSYAANDISAGGAEVTIDNCTFENGNNGVNAFGSTDNPAKLTIKNSSFKGYNQYAAYASSEISELTLENVTMEDIGRYALYCYTCDLEATDVTLTNVNKYKYKYEYYSDGELLFDNEFEQAGAAMYIRRGDVSLKNITISETESEALSISDSTVELENILVSKAVTANFARAAIDITWVDSSFLPNAVVSGIRVEGPVGYTPEMGSTVEVDGLRMVGYNDATTGEHPSGIIELYDVEIATDSVGRGVTGNGIFVDNFGDFLLNGVDVASPAKTGIVMNRTNGAITGVFGARSGIIDTAGAFGMSIDAARGTFDAATVSVTEVTVSSAAQSGINANSGTMTWSDVSVSGAAEYGAVCTEVTFSTCDASLEGTSGPTDGCDACLPPPT